MKLLYERYELLERDSKNVGVIWKGFQIITFIMAALLAMTSVSMLFIIINTFDSTCILYPKAIYFYNGTKEVHQSSLPVLNIDYSKSHFADIDTCSFSIFNPILSVIFSIIWIALFTMCPRGGSTISGLKKPWRIVIPTLIFCFIYSILCLFVSKNYQNGMNVFLAVLSNTTETEPVSMIQLEILKNVYIESTISVLCSWLYSMCWITAFLILCLRCVLGADFHYVRVKVELLEAPKSDSEPFRSIQNTAQSSELPSPQFSDDILETIDAQKKEDLDLKQRVVVFEKTNEIVTPALIHSE